jgi:hypothetical protein
LALRGGYIIAGPSSPDQLLGGGHQGINIHLRMGNDVFPAKFVFLFPSALMGFSQILFFIANVLYFHQGKSGRRLMDGAYSNPQ